MAKRTKRNAQPWKKPAAQQEDSGTPCGPELEMCPCCCSDQPARVGFPSYADLQVSRALAAWGDAEKHSGGGERAYEKKYLDASAKLAYLLTTRIPPFASFSRVQETAHCLCPEVGGRGLEALQLTKDPQGILEMLKLCDQCQPFSKEAFTPQGDHYIEILGSKCECTDAGCMDNGGIVYMSSWAKEASEGGVLEKNSKEAATFWLNTRRFLLATFLLALNEFQRTHDSEDGGEAYNMCMKEQLGNLPPPPPSTSRRPKKEEVAPNMNTRFAVGDKVACIANDWCVGTVVKVGYREPNWPPGKWAPYQVQLDKVLDDMGGAPPLIYVPQDMDFFCRAVTPLVPGHTVRIKGAKGDLAIHNGKVGVIRGAASQSQRESMASKDMHKVVFVEENGSVDAPASNLAMVGGPVPELLAQTIHQAVISASVPVVFTPQQATENNPGFPERCQVCMSEGVELLLARRFGHEVLVECVECCKVFAASHRFLHHPTALDDLDSAVETWLEDTYDCTEDALNHISNLVSEASVEDETMLFIRAALEGIKITKPLNTQG